MPDFSAAIALLRKPIEDLYSSSSGLVKEKISILRTASKMNGLHKKLWESQRVKTIWHTDRPLSLSTFFYPVSVSNEDNEGSTKLTSLENLENNHNIIFGTVGQGKSILMRYLLGREIRSGVRVPVFCELRNVEEKSLFSYLTERFSLLLGIKTDIELMTHFAEKGKISFLLDGFDEIDTINVQKTLVEIDDLSYKFPMCRIVLSSRPDTECKNLSNFYANRISPLENEDLFGFYKKITKDEEFTNRLVNAITASPVKIKELVKTPLLATLLAISYQTAHKIPLDFAEFYDELFQILLVRHDGSKLGWRRQRKTKLNDREIQQIFEAFCFATRRRQTITLDRENAYQFAIESIRECDVTSDPQGFIEDVKNITCLLVDEAKKINFVHASVQEFFAARYIKTRTEPVAEKFYSQLLAGKWANWMEEIQFLRQIDTHRSTKYFILPDIEKTIKDILFTSDKITKDTIDNYLKTLLVKKRITLRDGVSAENYYIDKKQRVNTYHYQIINTKIYSILFRQNFPGENNWRSGFQQQPEKTTRSYFEICIDKGPASYAKVSEVAAIWITQQMREKLHMLNSIRKNESPSQFIDL
ncbi:NACHT domain-containing protein [Janthinobacterium sp. PLB04]|uniref:NACHT domain-containing protein n=1 Tax=Janthinobacterium lividum TaxID=29581 RepID=A0AAJ4MNB5_9BURK|nr:MULTISPECIES: NACHT domain-containing protein [Janthinobacterium]KAB0324982.1 NACHT domain-containing protein [Janthinobacterium lividum]QSX94072.1 NACHT domain-containing protein [Janthinobacterium lividum]UGQ33834.1 NACHT domain-containing protein [Janthinobacterium sp. PLB04]